MAGASTIKIGKMVDTSEGTTTLARQWLALRDERDAIEEQLKGVKEQIATVGEKLMQSFSEDGIARTSVDGMTVHIISDLKISAKNGDYEDAVNTLRAVGLGEIVREQFNAQTLKAVVKDIMQQAFMGDEDSAAKLKGLEESFTIFELYNLSARKSSNSKTGDRFLKNGESQ